MQENSRRNFVLSLAGAALSACGGVSQRPPAAPEAAAGASDPLAAATSPSGMPLRPLGSTGVNVSILGLGGSHIGQASSEQESVRLIHKAIDNGITFLD